MGAMPMIKGLKGTRYQYDFKASKTYFYMDSS